MTEKQKKNSQDALDRTGEFFSVGPPLHAVKPSYVRRTADELLYQTLVAGNYAHVIAPGRSGKSSLISATAARLQNNGVKVAVINLRQIVERDGGTDAGRWYYSIAYRLLRQLRLKVDLQAWWQDNALLSNRQRLIEFYVDVILSNVQERIVVFVDDIQYIANLPFDEQILASIRAAHNARTTELEFSRLTFALLGECDPGDFKLDPTLSPFVVSQEIQLHDFTRENLKVFATELNLPAAEAGRALDRIYEWTSGQPYLSQKLARSIAREAITGDIEGHVDRIVQQQLLGRGATRNEPHLSHLHRRITSDRKYQDALLNLYGRVRKGLRVSYAPESVAQRKLRASGLVVSDEAGDLAPRNKIYETVFTAMWANENLPLHWRGPAMAAAVILVALAVPFAYTQMLPKPYTRIITTSSFDLETVADAYANLRSFPGHAESADRLFQSTLEHRAREAPDRAAISTVARYARMLPDAGSLADGMVARFWDRQTTAAARDGRRDDALLASLESLIVSTQERRRRAATLVGDDYAQLLATHPAQAAEGVVFDAARLRLTYYAGSRMSQWALTGQVLEAREPWTMSALDVTPLVRRVVVDREGLVNRLGLAVNVSHARLDDIRMKLIAPSGRAVELVFGQAASAANAEVRIGREQLAPLIGEPLSGTWSLSLRDESTGVTGHLVGWRLSLDSQALVENFERGLDIPDPVERASEDLWFSPDGRYAIARARQSDSARLWDLDAAEAARTIAIPANERVLGLGPGASFLVTLTQDSLNLWQTASGRRSAVLNVGSVGLDAVLTGDGAHVLVPQRSDIDTRYELWSLQSGEIVAEHIVAGAPALVAMDGNGRHLAVADYDRAVRVWDIVAGELVSQIDLPSQPSRVLLSADGASLGAVHGDQGVSLWRVDRPAVPLLKLAQQGQWQVAFSASGARFMAGNVSQGYQVYRSRDGAISSPLFDAATQPGGRVLLAFSADENTVLTAGRPGVARFWSAPPTALSVTAASDNDIQPGHQLWSTAGDALMAIAPGAGRIAIGDSSGHVHVMRFDDTVGEISEVREEISFVGHRGAVVSLLFNDDASLVASAGADGTVRIWDGASGLPRPNFTATLSARQVHMAFSPSSARLAILSGLRVWIMDVDTGASLADIELGENHTGLTFAADGELYLGSDSGTLRGLYADRTGNWHMRSVWQGDEAIRQLGVSVARQQIVIVDAANEARLLDIASGSVGSATLRLPDEVLEVAFSPNNVRVLFKTGSWIHRTLLAPDGLYWTDAIRAPRSLNGSRMAFDHDSADDDSVLVLTRDTGLARIAELHFDYDAGPALFGNRRSLLEEWTRKVRGEQPIGFVREGF